MASFDAAVAAVLRHEGGVSNHPLDAGSMTNRGITLATYSAWLKRTATAEEVAQMPLETAKQIYKVSYWGVIMGDGIKSEALATNFMDMAVLRGVVAAIKTMQSCVGAVTDGLMGPKTLAAINAKNPGVLVIDYFVASQKALAALVVAKPTQIVFLNNWMMRVADMLDPIAVAMLQPQSTSNSASKSANSP